MFLTLKTPRMIVESDRMAAPVGVHFIVPSLKCCLQYANDPCVVLKHPSSLLHVQH